VKGRQKIAFGEMR